MKYVKITIVSILVLSTLSFSQNVRKKVIEGNKAFAEENFDDALTKYRDAQTNDPESDLLKFNIGDAEYKKQKYEEAMQQFQASLTTDDVVAQSEAYYNIGNTLYRQQKLPEAITAYEQALKLNPEDDDAKYNLEFVRKMLKNQQDQQNQDQQNQQQNQQQQQQQNQQQNQDQQDQQEQQQQEQQQQSGEDEQEQEQQEQEQQQSEEPEQQEDQEQQQQEQQQQQMSPEDLSKEDAERILQALQEAEEDMKDARKQKMQGNVNVLKDW